MLIGDFNAYNTLKHVSISDINYSLQPSIGTQNLYFKNINDFASAKFDETKKVDNTIEFDTSSEDEIDFSTPILFNNCANPLTLCYINSNLKSNYTLTDIYNISYNGSILKNCNITLNSLSCKLNCMVKIVNNADETYTCPITLNIPLSTENSTIYDGSLVVNDSTSYNFIKQQ